ncbi:hypothetical protein [Paenibacillus polymyxa]|uniref:Uncharacterized protein n=1 Tax=Paenibacillus polymyxa (strain SC2) TaxID=886882 RepID=A0A0D5ZCP3_PAEPS|nr:hypothetical protein [Paenibacillus polymyxa]AKA44339.1 hypothetical protein PPSC2_26015 [Paenibacillus polymyxa SC2]
MFIGIPYVSTLEDMSDSITKDTYPFITFRVQQDNEIVSNVTIPHCRFRATDYENLIEGRSCDCGGSICGHPTQSLYLSKSQLKNYILVEEQSSIAYVFVYQIANQIAINNNQVRDDSF